LPKGLNSTKKQDLDKKWATFVYETNIPFNVVRHLVFIEAMKKTSESWTYCKPSSYYGLHTYLLKQSKVDVSKQVTKRTWNFIHKYGTTICSDGWDNIAQRPFLNVMFGCSSGNVFIGSIDIIGEGKMPIIYVIHWVDTSKPLESTTLYKFVQTMFWAWKVYLTF
jgi:hypothetical protein